MKYAVASLFALLTALSAFSQKGKDYFLVDSVNYNSLPAGDKAVLDSLLPIYHAASHDTTRMHILVALTESVNTEHLWPQYNNLLFDRIKVILQNSASLSPAVLTSLKRSYAMSLQNKGFFEENFNGNIPAALEYYTECEKIQKEIDDKKGLAITLNNMGIAFHSQGDITKSLEYYMQSLKMQEELNDKVGMAYALNNIASTHIEQGDTAKAIEYQMRSIALREVNGDHHGLAISLSNLAAIYNSRGETDKALSYFTRCVKLWETLGEKQGLGYCWRYLGVIHQRKAEKLKREGKEVPDSLLIRAEEYFLKSLKLYEGVGDNRGLSLILVLLGEHYLYEKNIPKALEYGQRSMAISREIGYPINIRSSSELMYSIYKQQGKWKEALAMHELATQMKDSVFNMETKKSIVQKEMKYEYEKKQAVDNAEHQKELAIAEEGKKRQQLVSYGIGGGLLMVILFAILIFNRLQVARKQKLIIEQKNKHITDSINYAKRIQDAILPSGDEMRKSFPDHFIFFQPREIVSGDFYWFSRQGNKTVVAVADCTGHGVPGAFMSMIGNTLLNEIVNEQKIIAPAEILIHLNEGIVHALHQESRSQDDGMDIGVCLVDHNTGTLTFAGANHSLFIVNSGTLSRIEGDYFSIGSMFGKKAASFTQTEVSLQKNTCVFLSTDGYADQPGGEKGKKFMSRRFEELLRSVSTYEAFEQCEMLKTTFEEWKNTKQQVDDVLILGIKCR